VLCVRARQMHRRARSGASHGCSHGCKWDQHGILNCFYVTRSAQGVPTARSGADLPSRVWRSTPQEQTDAYRRGAASCSSGMLTLPSRTRARPPSARVLAIASECEDLPLTTSGARPTGMQECSISISQRSAARLSAEPRCYQQPRRTHCALPRPEAISIRHTTAQMHLRADEHLTARRALRAAPEAAGRVGQRPAQPGRNSALYCSVPRRLVL